MNFAKLQKIAITVTFSLLLAACGKTLASVPASQPAPNVPGQIRGIVFEDKNINGVLDKGEVGIQYRVGINKGACAAQEYEEEIDTNTDGTFLFKDLTPGTYCVSPVGNPVMYSKLEVEVNLPVGGDTFVSFATGQ